MMKCYYDILSISRDASEEEIKRSYRKLALQWHPDKNLDNIEEAKLQFQLVQQAYEVLSDANERAWYDKHRESILKGGIGNEYEDKSLDVFQYFTSSCFDGYGDDERGFYSVYREVFNKIAAEDSEYYSDGDSDFEIPNFGKSDSLFDEVVNPFYLYWQSYCTKKSYAWLNLYDIREAPNRKVVRLMEKDNKKVRDKARKERNEEVRALVAFVKKRDKRVQAHALYVKAKKDDNTKKVEEQRQMKLKHKKEEIASYQEVEWSKFSNLEKQLKDIEAGIAKEFGDASSEDEESCDDDSNVEIAGRNETLYCVACNKMFKTTKAFQNHENSKKHKENVASLKQSVLGDELNNENSSEDENENLSGHEVLSSENEELVYDKSNVEMATTHHQTLYCDVCSKIFKTGKAFQNHEKSKKHKESIATMKQSVLGDKLSIGNGHSSEDEDDLPGHEFVRSGNELFYDKCNVEMAIKNDETLYCDVCCKMFRTEKAFKNHEHSKRHKENIKMLKDSVLNYDLDSTNTTCEDENENKSSCDNELKNSTLKNELKFLQNKEEEILHSEYIKKRKNKTKHKNVQSQLDLVNGYVGQEYECSDNLLNGIELGLSKKQKKKVSQQQFLLDNINQSKRNTSNKSSESSETCNSFGMKRDQPPESNIVEENSVTSGQESNSNENNVTPTNARPVKENPVHGHRSEIICVMCKCSFPSKNKLFDHLKKSGHAIYLGSENNEVTKNSKGKKRR